MRHLAEHFLSGSITARLVGIGFTIIFSPMKQNTSREIDQENNKEVLPYC